MMTRWWFRIWLPIIWCLTAWISVRHPGDEYGLWGVACLPAIWLMLVVRETHPLDVQPLVYGAGILTTGLVGCWLDAWRMRRIVWLILWGVGMTALVASALSGYESYHRAIMKNGSLTAYVSAAASLSLVLTSAVSIAGIGLWRVGLFAHSKLRSLYA